MFASREVGDGLLVAPLLPTARVFLIAISNDKRRIGSMSTVELPAKPFISVQDAAEILGCTVGRVRQLLMAGTLDGQKLNERAWAVERKSVEKYAKQDIRLGRPRVAKES